MKRRITIEYTYLQNQVPPTLFLEGHKSLERPVFEKIAGGEGSGVVTFLKAIE